MDGDLRDDDKKTFTYITSQFASCFNPAASRNQIVVDNLAMSFQHNNGTETSGDAVYFLNLAASVGRLGLDAAKRYPLA